MTALTLDLEWRTTLLTAVLFPLLLGLGFWQLDRADEKTRIAAQDAQRAGDAAVPLDELIDAKSSALAYRRVTVSGHFLSEAVILLDNQIRNGRYGHDVYGLFLDKPSGHLVLLNRGWVPGDPSRRSLPQVELPDRDLSLTATVYVPPGEPYLLAKDSFTALDWPLLVQTAASSDLRELISRETGLPVFARELRLLPGQPEGFRRDWPVVNVSPEKHQGYAVQWFTMAAALLLFFAIRSSNILSLFRGGRQADSDPIDQKEQ